MTTVSPYDPVLTYEPSFDKSEGDKQKTYVVSTGPPPGNKERTKSKYIRIFDGDSVEELLFTIINFESLATDLSMENNDRIEQFQQILGPAPRAVWNLMISTRGRAFPVNRWEAAKNAFIKEYAEDEDARDTVIAAFTTGDFLKPAEVSVKDHFTRIMEICSYINLLPSTINSGALTDNQKKNLFFNSFPKTWRYDYKRSAHDIRTATITQVKNFFFTKKHELDKEYKKKKSEKEKKHKDGSKQSNRGGKGGRGGKGPGGLGPDSKCKKHPDGNHLWKD